MHRSQMGFGQKLDIGSSGKQFDHLRICSILRFLEPVELLLRFASFDTVVIRFFDELPKNSAKLFIDVFDDQDYIQIFGGPEICTDLVEYDGACCAADQNIFVGIVLKEISERNYSVAPCFAV